MIEILSQEEKFARMVASEREWEAYKSGIFGGFWCGLAAALIIVCAFRLL